MPIRSRAVVLALIFGVGLATAAINEIGPLPAHEPLSYNVFISDFTAGRVDHFTRWRSQLEVAEGTSLRTVVVPADADLAGDLGHARVTGGVPISYNVIPSVWVFTASPFIPAAMALAALALCAQLLRRARSSGQPAAVAPA